MPLLHLSLEFGALFVAAILYLIGHRFWDTMIEKLSPSGLNMYFVFKPGNHPASHVSVGNGRGRIRQTDDRGCIKNVPRCWAIEGQIINILLPDRVIQVAVRLSASGEPRTIEITQGSP